MYRFYKSFLLFILGVIVSPSVLLAQYENNFTNDAVLVSQSTNSAVIRSSGIHEKKKEAVQMAVLSAFDTYFFSGIAGLNNDQPVIQGDITPAQKTYLSRIFDEGRYVQFVSGINEVDDSPVKLPNKQYKATVQFNLNTVALYRDMIRNKVLSKPKPKVEVKPEELPMFTITIVPFRQEGETYSQILREEADIRPVISRIESHLKNRGYEVKDFLAVVDAAERNLQFEMDNTVQSNDNLLINQTQADVYITVDLGCSASLEGAEGLVSLKGYEVSTGNILCSDFSRSKRYRKYTYMSLYERALEGCLDRFLNQLGQSWSKKKVNGKMYTLRFSVAPESTIDMSCEVGPEALPLSSMLEQWVKNNSMNKKYHKLGHSSDGIFFDQVFVEDGFELDFNNSLYKYLRDELELNCDCRQSGNTFYITIQ